jgi:ATP-dependent protease ClpP protease subunit
MSQLDNKSDWILNAEEAVYYGFADGVLGDRKFNTIDKLKNRKR